MNRKMKILTLLSVFTLVSCNQSPKKGGDEPFVPSRGEIFEVHYSGFYNASMTQKMSFNKSLFLKENVSSTFNIDMAYQSYALTLSANKASDQPYSSIDANFRYFANQLDFKNVYVNDLYNQKSTKDTLGYCFATKELNEYYNLLAIGIRGTDYGAEWANNFLLGKEGDHLGFSTWAKTIIEDMKTYMNDHNLSFNNTKIWVSGYSRAGAIANLVGTYIDDLIFKGVCPGLTLDDVFVYTFEAAQGALKTGENDKYTNIINIRSGHDFIPYVLPNVYNFTVNGQIYVTSKIVSDKTLTKELKRINKTIEIPHFTGKKLNILNFEISDDPDRSDLKIDDYWDYLINTYLSKVNATSAYPDLVDISTRDKIVDNLQDASMHFFDIFFNLTSQQESSIVSTITSQDPASLVSIITGTNPDALFNVVSAAFTTAGVSYEEETLRSDCKDLQALASAYYLSDPSNFLFKEVATIIGNVNSIIFNHSIETGLAYLNHLFEYLK